jgi:hypothetical protein
MVGEIRYPNLIKRGREREREKKKKTSKNIFYKQAQIILFDLLK